MKFKNYLYLVSLLVVIVLLLYPFFKRKQNQKMNDSHVAKYGPTELTISSEIVRIRNCDYLILYLKSGQTEVVHCGDCTHNHSSKENEK